MYTLSYLNILKHSVPENKVHQRPRRSPLVAPTSQKCENSEKFWDPEGPLETLYNCFRALVAPHEPLQVKNVKPGKTQRTHEGPFLFRNLWKFSKLWIFGGLKRIVKGPYRTPGIIWFFQNFHISDLRALRALKRFKRVPKGSNGVPWYFQKCSESIRAQILI